MAEKKKNTNLLALDIEYMNKINRKKRDLNNNIHLIEKCEIDITAYNQNESAVCPTQVCFTNVTYTPSSYPRNGVIRLLGGESHVHINRCLRDNIQFDHQKFIDSFNGKYEAVEIISIQSINIDFILDNNQVENFFHTEDNFSDNSSCNVNL